MPYQLALHAMRVFGRYDFDESSCFEEDFLHQRASIPPWNFATLRTILVKRRSQLTFYVSGPVLAIDSFALMRSVTPPLATCLNTRFS
jgi:hypothetical protein